MADEQKDETTVTDSALDKAAEGAEETQSQETEAGVSETPKKEQTEAEKEEQRERSALGRKVKALEDKFDRFLERAETLFQNPPATSKDETSVFNSDDYLTVNKLEELLEYRDGKKAQKQKETLRKYEDKYLDTFARLGAEEKLDDDEFAKIDEIMRKSFNASYSNYADPTADAERNFLKALRSYEKDKASKKSLNLKGDTPKGTGVGGGTKMVGKEPKMPELDSFAKDFVNFHKIKEENVAQTLDGETPMRLKKR